MWQKMVALPSKALLEIVSLITPVVLQSEASERSKKTSAQDRVMTIEDRPPLFVL
jgi:hypothetical protein